MSFSTRSKPQLKPSSGRDFPRLNRSVTCINFSLPCDLGFGIRFPCRAEKKNKLLFSLLQTSLEAKTKVELLERWGH